MPFPCQAFCPEVMCKDYVFVRISRCQVIPAFSQHTSKSYCACRANLTLPEVPLHMLCTLPLHLMSLGVLCVCPPVGFHKHNKLDVTQTFWINSACSDHVCSTCTTGLVVPWGLDTVILPHSSWGCIQCRKSSEQDHGTIRNHAFYWEPLGRVLP